jgi:hypothetical protein
MPLLSEAAAFAELICHTRRFSANAGLCHGPGYSKTGMDRRERLDVLALRPLQVARGDVAQR